MTDEQRSQFNTLWETYGRSSVSHHNSHSSPSENNSNTVGFDLFSDEDEDEAFDPFALADSQASTPAPSGATISPVAPEHSLPPPQQSTILPNQEANKSHASGTQPFPVAPPQRGVNPVLWFILILVVGPHFVQNL